MEYLPSFTTEGLGKSSKRRGRRVAWQRSFNKAKKKADKLLKQGRITRSHRNALVVAARNKLKKRLKGQKVRRKKQQRKKKKKTRKAIKRVVAAGLIVTGGILFGGKIIKGIKSVGGKIFGSGAKATAAAGGAKPASVALAKSAGGVAAKKAGGGLIDSTGRLIASGSKAVLLAQKMQAAQAIGAAQDFPDDFEIPSDVIESAPSYQPISTAEVEQFRREEVVGLKTEPVAKEKLDIWKIVIPILIAKAIV